MPKAASSTAKERVVCRHIRGSNWGRYSVDNHHTLFRATSEASSVARWAIWGEFLNAEVEDEHKIGLSPTNFVSIENRAPPTPTSKAAGSHSKPASAPIFRDRMAFGSAIKDTPWISVDSRWSVKLPLDSLHIIGTPIVVSGDPCIASRLSAKNARLGLIPPLQPK
jgi:hypothetical protein